jgi:hypothetical protein
MRAPRGRHPAYRTRCLVADCRIGLRVRAITMTDAGHLGAGSRGFLIASGPLKQALLTTFFGLPGILVAIFVKRAIS